MKRLKYIIQGFFNLLLIKLGLKIDDSAYIQMVNKRLTLCNSCENQAKSIGICKVCGCYCRAKSSVMYDIDEEGKSIDGCPLKKW